MDSSNKIRCFVSLDIPQDIIEYANQIQRSIKKANYVVAKYTKPSNLHLTLKFLGEIPQTKIDTIIERLTEVQFSPFIIKIEEIGVFSRRKIRIIWLKVDGAKELQKQIDEALQNDFNREERFMGHITIARVKKVGNKEALLSYLDNYTIKPQRTKVLSFQLKQSILTPSGPIYKTIKSFNAT